MSPADAVQSVIGRFTGPIILAVNVLLARFQRNTGLATVTAGRKTVRLPEFGWNGYENRWEIHAGVSSPLDALRLLAGAIKANSGAVYTAARSVPTDLKQRPVIYFFDIAFADNPVPTDSVGLTDMGALSSLVVAVALLVDTILSFFGLKDDEEAAPPPEPQTPPDLSDPGNAPPPTPQGGTGAAAAKSSNAIPWLVGAGIVAKLLFF